MPNETEDIGDVIARLRPKFQKIADGVDDDAAAVVTLIIVAAERAMRCGDEKSHFMTNCEQAWALALRR